MSGLRSLQPYLSFKDIKPEMKIILQSAQYLYCIGLHNGIDINNKTNTFPKYSPLITERLLNQGRYLISAKLTHLWVIQEGRGDKK